MPAIFCTPINTPGGYDFFLERQNPIGLQRQADEVGRSDEVLVLFEL